MIQSLNRSLGRDRLTDNGPGKVMEMRLGTWNIKTFMGKEVELVGEMEKYKINVLGLSEVKKKGEGEIVLDKGVVFRYSGVSKGSRAKEGVGIVVDRETDKKVSNWKPITSRIIRVDLSLQEELSLIQVYALLITAM